MHTRFSNTDEGRAAAIAHAAAGGAGFIACPQGMVKQLQKDLLAGALKSTTVPIELIPQKDPPVPSGDAGILVRKFT